MISAIIRLCKCIPPYLPKSVANTGVPICKYSQHVNCTSFLLMDFNYAGCNCPTPCSELEYKKTVYYTEMHENFRQKTYKLMRNYPDIALASVRISLPDSKEFQHREEPDYGVSQYLSDVGGAMGLVLGASLVSVLELFDCLIYGARKSWRNKKQVNQVGVSPLAK